MTGKGLVQHMCNGLPYFCLKWQLAYSISTSDPRQDRQCQNNYQRIPIDSWEQFHRHVPHPHFDHWSSSFQQWCCWHKSHDPDSFRPDHQTNHRNGLFCVGSSSIHHCRRLIVKVTVVLIQSAIGYTNDVSTLAESNIEEGTAIYVTGLGNQYHRLHQRFFHSRWVRYWRRDGNLRYRIG